MAIHNLGLSGRLNEAGKIKIGKKGELKKSVKGKEFNLPVKLDHFEITTTERDKNGGYVVDKELMETIPLEKGAIENKNGDTTGIPIKLLFDDIERNFPTKLISYVFGKLNCTGDGREAFKAVSNFETSCKCPCERITPGYDGDDKCKPFGTLTCIIDGVELFGQVHTFRTTSANSINGILGGIALVKEVTKGRLAGVPLVLTLTTKTTIIPGTGTKTTIYVVSICYNGSLESLRKDALELYQNEQKYISDVAFDNGFKDEKDEQDFIEEYFPGQEDDENVDDVDNASSDTDNELSSETPTDIGAEKSKGLELENSNSDVMYTPEEIEKMKPVGQYGLLYDRLLEEKDPEKAYKLANRLMVSGLKYFLITKYWDVPFEKADKKPAILEIIREVLNAALEPVDKPDEESTKEPVEEKDDELKPDFKSDESEKKRGATRLWDDSSGITDDQLREIITLKKELNTSGALEPTKEAWAKHVAYFFDKAGDPVKTAKDLTTVQGNTFIIMLKSELGPF